MSWPTKFELNLVCKYTETAWPIRGQKMVGIQQSMSIFTGAIPQISEWWQDMQAITWTNAHWSTETQEQTTRKCTNMSAKYPSHLNVLKLTWTTTYLPFKGELRNIYCQYSSLKSVIPRAHYTNN